MSTALSNTISGNEELEDSKSAAATSVDFEVYDSVVKERDHLLQILAKKTLELQEERERLELERAELEEDKRVHREKVEALQYQLAEWVSLH